MLELGNLKNISILLNQLNIPLFCRFVDFLNGFIFEDNKLFDDHGSGKFPKFRGRMKKRV